VLNIEHLGDLLIIDVFPMLIIIDSVINNQQHVH